VWSRLSTLEELVDRTYPWLSWLRNFGDSQQRIQVTFALSHRERNSNEIHKRTPVPRPLRSVKSAPMPRKPHAPRLSDVIMDELVGDHAPWDLDKHLSGCLAGKTWGPSTIHGNWRRGTGILNNELYIGRLVWNR
jgi:hypothetical protein